MIEIFSIVALVVLMSAMTGPSSDAAAGLGDPGDLRGRLRRALREELVELLDAHTGGLAEDTDGGAGALVRVLGAHEADDRPVRVAQLLDALFACDSRRHVLGPPSGVGEEALVVEGDGD